MGKVAKLHPVSADPVPTQMHFNDFEALLPCTNQRNHEKRASMPHFRTFKPTHLVVAAARLPDGTMHKLDGHTRVIAALLGFAPHLKSMTFTVMVYDVASVEEMEALYDTFDNPAAQKKSSDNIFGAMNSLGILGRSKWCLDAGFGSGLKAASDIWAGSNGLRVANYRSKDAQVELFSGEITKMDEWDINQKRFPIGVMAAAFLTIKKHGDDAARFWMKYNETFGVIQNQERDCVAMLHGYLKEQRLAGTMGGGEANKHHQHRALAYYMRDFRTPGKLFRREPTAITGREFLAL